MDLESDGRLATAVTTIQENWLFFQAVATGKSELTQDKKRLNRAAILKDWDIKIVIVLHALFGAFLGFLIFTLAFDNIDYVFLGRQSRRGVVLLG